MVFDSVKKMTDEDGPTGPVPIIKFYDVWEPHKGNRFRLFAEELQEEVGRMAGRKPRILQLWDRSYHDSCYLNAIVVWE